ncbi:hypothetical protein [Streptomyces sp. NPDC088812]|uniref:hypothetical protein n=1 Tax=Streptomyces sp. NPDC088812 TaxID=3365905 RepID=UPI0038065F78
MTITMQNYALTWTSADGIPRASAVAYDEPTAALRRTELAAAGCTDVEIVPVRPGVLPDPRA